MKKNEALPWNNLTTLQCFPQIILDIFMSDVVSDLLLHGQLPSENLLVCEAIISSQGLLRDLLHINKRPTREEVQPTQKVRRNTTDMDPIASSQPNLPRKY